MQRAPAIRNESYCTGPRDERGKRRLNVVRLFHISKTNGILEMRAFHCIGRRALDFSKDHHESDTVLELYY